MTAAPRRSPQGNPVTAIGKPLAWPEPWARLARACGGVAALSTRLETPRRTLERWAYGGELLGAARVAVRYVAAEVGVRSPV